MKTVERHFELDAGHRLAKHDFKCQNLHGHRYIFDVTITGKVSKDTGLLMDFSHIKNPVMEAFDHNTILNKDDPLMAIEWDSGEPNSDMYSVASIIGMNQNKDIYTMSGEPTVENIADESAKLIFEAMSRDERNRITEITLEVYETPNCKVESTYELICRAVDSDQGKRVSHILYQKQVEEEDKTIARIEYDE